MHVQRSYYPWPTLYHNFFSAPPQADQPNPLQFLLLLGISPRLIYIYIFTTHNTILTGNNNRGYYNSYITPPGVSPYTQIEYITREKECVIPLPRTFWKGRKRCCSYCTRIAIRRDVTVATRFVLLLGRPLYYVPDKILYV